MESFNFNLTAAITDLQSPSSGFSDRIHALRYLQTHVHNTKEITATSKRQVNQLILDNILKILMGEDNVVDLPKRQLVKAELFLMLSGLLNSDALFGDMRTQINELLQLHVTKINSSDSNPTLQVSKAKGSPFQVIKQHPSMPHDRNDSNEMLPRNNHSIMSSSMTELSSSNARNSYDNNSRTSINSPNSRSSMSSPSKSLLSQSMSAVTVSQRTRGNRDRGPATPTPTSSRGHPLNKISILHAAIAKTQLKSKKNSLNNNSRKVLFKSRPSVFYSDEYEVDDIVPGVDPTDWFEQDRKLGYQKSRMWFPVAGVSTDNFLIPQQRSGTENVVQEYMQMRALMSYVGDIIMPSAPTAATAAGDSKTGDMVSLKHRLEGVIDSKRYDELTKQAVKIWTPLHI